MQINSDHHHRAQTCHSTRNLSCKSTVGIIFLILLLTIEFLKSTISDRLHNHQSDRQSAQPLFITLYYNIALVRDISMHLNILKYIFSWKTPRQWCRVCCTADVMAGITVLTSILTGLLCISILHLLTAQGCWLWLEFCECCSNNLCSCCDNRNKRKCRWSRQYCLKTQSQ